MCSYQCVFIIYPKRRTSDFNQRIVVRPDRAVVIRHWIVAGFVLRHGADAPAGEEPGAKQPARHLGGAIRLRNAGEQHQDRKSTRLNYSHTSITYAVL